MKILQINKFFYLKGGSERYLFDLSDALVERGHGVIHFSMEHERNVASPYSKYFIPFIDFQADKNFFKAMHFLYSRDAARRIRMLIKKTKPDVAHVHNIAHQLTPSILKVLKAAGIPVVMTVHDYQLICPNYRLFTEGSPCERCKKHSYWNAVRYACVQEGRLASLLSGTEMTLHNVLLKSYDRYIDRFIAPSHFMQKKLIEWGKPADRIMYLPHFVKKKRNGFQKKAQVLFVGRLMHEKGAHLLLAAAKEFPNVNFFFAGEGEERDRLEQMAANSALKNCHFVGFQHAEALDQLVQESGAVVVPSLWYENAPFVVYEALALGTPVIAAKHGGLPELIQEGMNGFLFDPGSVAGLAKSLKMLFTHRSFDLPKDPYPVKEHIDALEKIYKEIS